MIAHRTALVGLLLLALSTTAPDAAAARPYPDGTIIQVTGLITDGEGNPIPDLRLYFEASRRSFDIKKLRRTSENPVRISTVTDAKGEYELEWRWHRYYNHFILSAVVGVGRPQGKEHIEVLATVDLSERMKQGSPVVAPLTIQETDFLYRFRDFLAGLDTGDEREVYTSMGKPDKVEALSFPDRREESWWYFEAGKTYRFTDGRLEEVVEFDPVEEF